MSKKTQVKVFENEALSTLAGELEAHILTGDIVPVGLYHIVSATTSGFVKHVVVLEYEEGETASKKEILSLQTNTLQKFEHAIQESRAVKGSLEEHLACYNVMMLGHGICYYTLLVYREWIPSKSKS